MFSKRKKADEKNMKSLACWCDMSAYYRCGTMIKHAINSALTEQIIENMLLM